MKKNIKEFNPFYFKLLNLNKKLNFIFKNYNNIFISNSLSPEDLLISYFIISKNYNFNNFNLNTGRLFLNNIKIINKFYKKYDFKIFQFFSNINLVNKYVKYYSLNGFYNNIFLRKICCYIRKIEPLNRILKFNDIWITGQRSSQSQSRNKILEYEYNFKKNFIKLNLISNWDFKDIFYFIEKFNILNNYLYNYGYISIGCEPCTKPIKYYENERDGRWWWEKYNKKKECGLHI